MNFQNNYESHAQFLENVFLSWALREHKMPHKLTKNNSQGIIFVIISCQRVVSTGACFRKGVRVPIGVLVLGRGVWGRAQGGGGRCPVKKKRKGQGVVGGGVGTGKGTVPASRCECVCQNYPLAIYPLVSPRSLT